MNKIYRIIWSKARNCYIVVSEIAKRNGKCSSSLNKKIIAAFLAAGTVMVSVLSSSAYAKTYEVDSISEDDFKSAVAVDHNNYTQGANSKTGAVTLGVDTKTASGLQTVTVGINATHAYLPNGKLVLVQESAVPSNANYNTYIGRFRTLEKTESERIAIITNKGVLSKTSTGSLSESSAMSADGTEFTGTYTAENGSVYNIVGKRGAKQSNGLYAWSTTITDQYGNVHTTSSINYMSIENPPADITNEYTVTAKYEDGNWTTNIVDQNGNVPTDPQMTTITGPVQKKNLEMMVGQVNKKANGYFMTNRIKTTNQITGEETVSESTVQVGDVVTASVNKNGTNYANDDSLTIKVNGENVATYTGVHYYSINDGGTQKGNYNNTGATGFNAIAAGPAASATKENSIAIGNGASATEEDTVVIGSSAVTGKNSIAIGTGHSVTGANSGAFGDPTTINGDNSYSVGNNNTIGEGFENVFALGNSITVVESNSVFLGDSAAYVAEGDSTGGLEEVSEATINSLTFDGFAGAAPVGVVSVGDAGKERRIQNVAAGLISATSTDAINGSQLYSAIDAMQFDIVAGDNVEVIKNTDDNGHTVYTIHALNAIVEAGPSGNVTVEATPGEGAESNGKTTDMTGGETGTAAGTGEAAGGTTGTTPAPTASEEPITPAGTNNHTTTYTVDAKDTYVVSGTVTTEATESSDKVVTTYKYNYDDKDSFNVDSKNTYVAKAEVVKAATDTDDKVKVQLSRNDGKSFDLDLNNTYVAKAEVTQAATDTDDKVKVQLSRNDGKSFDLDLNNTYVAKAEVTQQATDTSDDVTIELTRNDGKSFELATKNTYLAKAELADHTLTLSRNDGTEFVVSDLATLKDGMSYAGDTGEATVQLKQTVTVTGGAAELTDGNIGVVASQNGDNAKLEIKLAKEIKDVDSMAVNKTITVGGNTTIEGDKITTSTVNADTLKAGDTAINNEGMTINNGPSVTKDGIDAGGKKITNVAPGTADNDAVTMSQLRNESSNLSDSINRLDSRMKKGLAGAAALAALHPMDFNPDDKLQFAAGVGNYRGETAAALGAFYRPDESVMFSIGGTFGNADNMVNAGITFGLDGTRNRITRSRTAMAREIQDLRSLVTQMAARMDRMEAANGIETAMFPDVPENHWAYEYVEDLQKRGALKGYPDGLFKGDRAMTRYEFAAMLDRIVRSGVTLDPQIAKEFEPELGRIYVERISGQDNDRKKVERVRVNNSDSKYPEGKTRDVYGSKIVTETPGQAAEK